MTMIRYQENTAVVANSAQADSLPSLVKRAANQLALATSAAEILEARNAAKFARDALKREASILKSKSAHSEVIAAVRRSQADALEIEAMADKRLADEYDAAQERGEVARLGTNQTQVGVPSGNTLPTAADIGLSRKDIHEARQIRDAEAADPGIVRRTLDERLDAGQEPTKAAIREAVTEAAMRGLRGTPAPSNKNPLYRAPTKAGAAWTHLYGTCRGLVEWGSDENALLALHGKAERTDDQSANLAAIRKAADFLNKFLENVDA